ncbi:hypothetical protein Tco_0529966 [Tanacetum coccineum]
MGICRFAPDVTSKEKVEDVYLGLVEKLLLGGTSNSMCRSTWMAFGGNTRDLGLILGRNRRVYNSTPNLMKKSHTAVGDGVTILCYDVWTSKRRRLDFKALSNALDVGYLPPVQNSRKDVGFLLLWSSPLPQVLQRSVVCRNLDLIQWLYQSVHLAMNSSIRDVKRTMNSTQPALGVQDDRRCSYVGIALLTITGGLDTTLDLNYFLGHLVDDLWASELTISKFSHQLCDPHFANHTICLKWSSLNAGGAATRWWCSYDDDGSGGKEMVMERRDGEVDGGVVTPTVVAAAVGDDDGDVVWRWFRLWREMECVEAVMWLMVRRRLVMI